MRCSIIITIRIFVYMFCLNLIASEWTEVTKGKNGHTFFIDMKKLNETNNYVFFWQLINFYEKDEYGDLSAKIYVKGDCKVFKFKWLKVSYHKELMALDQVKEKTPVKLVSEWQFPRTGSTSHAVLEHACQNKGLLL